MFRPSDQLLKTRNLLPCRLQTIVRVDRLFCQSTGRDGTNALKHILEDIFKDILQKTALQGLYLGILPESPDNTRIKVPSK
jgi:hypothetical protein